MKASHDGAVSMQKIPLPMVYLVFVFSCCCSSSCVQFSSKRPSVFFSARKVCSNREGDLDMRASHGSRLKIQEPRLIQYRTANDRHRVEAETGTLRFHLASDWCSPKLQAENSSSRDASEHGVPKVACLYVERITHGGREDKKAPVRDIPTFGK